MVAYPVSASIEARLAYASGWPSWRRAAPSSLLVQSMLGPVLASASASSLQKPSRVQHPTSTRR